MIGIPNMVMIGGNSRNAGKTTLACGIISHFSATQEVIGLKVTSIRPGEEDLHGSHTDENTSGFEIMEELNPETGKDTSKMLKAGATHVYYLRVEDDFMSKAILHFMTRYINKQLIVCESRSLREIVIPGFFLMMLKLPAEGKKKDVSTYVDRADKVFYFGDDQVDVRQFVDSLSFVNDKFILTK